MLFQKPQTEKSGLEKAIDDLLSEMASVSCDTEEYQTMTNQLVKLYKLRKIDKPQKVHPDTWVIVAGNVLGILMIVGYEKSNVVASKALNLIMRLR